ncbi:MAG: hypothetical protein WC455_17140 [Dehalococcoidia bacterium]|jgi:hypothetical protein
MAKLTIKFDEDRVIVDTDDPSIRINEKYENVQVEFIRETGNGSKYYQKMNPVLKALNVAYDVMSTAMHLRG